MIYTHWALVWWTWHWDREGTKESFNSQHLSMGSYCGAQKMLEKAVGWERRSKRSGRGSCEMEATIRELLLWSATVPWVCSNPHGLHPRSEARRSVGSSSECSSASMRGTGRAGPYVCVDCCCPWFSPEGLVATNRAKAQPLQCCGAAMVNALQK